MFPIHPRCILFFGIAIGCLATGFSSAAERPNTTPHQYQTEAAEVTTYIQQNLYDQKTGLYFHTLKDRGPDFTWSNGIIFSQLLGAARHDPKTYLPIISRFFKAMDRYWDFKEKIPGYEPAPTNGNGTDKYYDDNQWMVITFAEAYEMTRDQPYLKRSEETLKFSLSGWDEQLGGGIWWHEGHKGGGKNTCSNAPAAVACLRVARYLPPAQARNGVAMAAKIVDWTNSHLLASDDLYMDNENATTEKKSNAKLTYNTALMIRAELGLYRWTGDAKYLQLAKRSSQAANSFMSSKTNAYRDAMKWSHLQVEADLEMYRYTHDESLMIRAKKNADHAYSVFKEKLPEETIDVAAIARTLWLLADTESETGRQFWERSDRVPK